MKIGDTVWVPHPGLGGGPTHAREWRVEYAGFGMVGLRYGHQHSSCAPENAYATREACEAAIALRAAAEAVAKARDAVVEAAVAWEEYEPRDERDDGHIDALQSAVTDLRCAERIEAEAAVRLEALR